MQATASKQGECTSKSVKKIVLNILNNFDDVTNEWTIEDIASKRCPSDWKQVFEDAKLELKDISDILQREKKVNGQWYPDNSNIFRAFQLTPLSQVRVVIIGQDPYHNRIPGGPPQAQGLCFSVPKIASIPSSLRNIFKELKNTVENFKVPTHGDLTCWAKQGVLLLNSCLTVLPGRPGCHKELWLGFIKKVVNAVLDENPNCIFVMWGNKAKKIKKILGGRATMLEAAHPSGYSANRGFFGCDHFNEINRILGTMKRAPINWNLE